MGKSYLAYGISLAVATGAEFLERRPQSRRILYFDEEHSRQEVWDYFHSNWAGLKADISLLDSNFRFEHLTLGNSPTPPVELIEAAVKEYQPELIVIDTWTYALRIIDENSNSEGAAMIRDLRRIKGFAPPDASMLILHHTRQNKVGKRVFLDVFGAKALRRFSNTTIFHVIPPGARKRADGTRRTQLSFEKIRLWKAAHDLIIDPQPCGKGLKLTVGKAEK